LVTPAGNTIPEVICDQVSPKSVDLKNAESVVAAYSTRENGSFLLEIVEGTGSSFKRPVSPSVHGFINSAACYCNQNIMIGGSITMSTIILLLRLVCVNVAPRL
jgi:hypothetical protein